MYVTVCSNTQADVEEDNSMYLVELERNPALGVTAAWRNYGFGLLLPKTNTIITGD